MCLLFIVLKNLAKSMVGIRVFHARSIFLITFVLFCLFFSFFFYIYKLKFSRNYKLSFFCNLNYLFCSSILRYEISINFLDKTKLQILFNFFPKKIIIQFSFQNIYLSKSLHLLNRIKTLGPVPLIT